MIFLKMSYFETSNFEKIKFEKKQRGNVAFFMATSFSYSLIHQLT